MKKQYVAIAAAAVVVAGACSIGFCSRQNGEDNTETTEAVTTEESSTGIEVSDNETADNTLINTSGNEVGTDDYPSSIELTYLMGNGINLCNTMEAFDTEFQDWDLPAKTYETCWQQPETTKEMIVAMHEAGYDTLRIPVAWTNTMDYMNGDFEINQDYLDRVGEIINYALDDGMYVIVNEHYDNGWWGLFGSASEENRELAMKVYTSMWSQIAEAYANYSDKLIFESANEELGGLLNDNRTISDSGTLDADSLYSTTNEINQAFVNTVRAAGGNNKNRFLLIAGFNTDITGTLDSRFKMPNDSANDKLLLSVHFYSPTNYSLYSSVNSWGTATEYEFQTNLFSALNTFTDNGYGIVIGEYKVALNSEGERKNNVAEYITNILDNCDYFGYCPILWEDTYMFDKNTCSFSEEFKDIAEIYKTRSFMSQLTMTQNEEKEKALESINKATQTAKDNNIFFSDDPYIATAWLMFNSSDYNITFSVGDTLNTNDASEGIKSEITTVRGEGEYTVSLDFTGTSSGAANGIAFSALGIYNGESLYPGYTITIEQILINGIAYDFNENFYTTSDDGSTTRVNLYNSWVSSIPEDARFDDEDDAVLEATATIIDGTEIGKIETIEVTFLYNEPSEEWFIEQGLPHDTVE